MDELQKHLKARTSPEQIAEILKQEYYAIVGPQVIYRYIADDRANGGFLFKSLRRK